VTLCFIDEVRQDMEDAVSHMKPWLSEDGSTFFGGWARMAQPIVDFNIVEVNIVVSKVILCLYSERLKLGAYVLLSYQ